MGTADIPKPSAEPLNNASHIDRIPRTLIRTPTHGDLNARTLTNQGTPPYFSISERLSVNQPEVHLLLSVRQLLDGLKPWIRKECAKPLCGRNAHPNRVVQRLGACRCAKVLDEYPKGPKSTRSRIVYHHLDQCPDTKTQVLSPFPTNPSDLGKAL